MGRMNEGQGRARCEVCGNRGKHAFEVHLGGEKHTFDSFECAIRGLMPRCDVCGCIVLGPGVQEKDSSYCSDLCAGLSSVRGFEAPFILR